jgi:hypothetical protein
MEQETISQVEKELFFTEPEPPRPETTFFDYLPYTSNYMFMDENHKIHVMSEQDKKLSFKREILGNRIKITLEDGTTGSAKCCPEDEFDVRRGTDIAYYRALIRHYNKFLKKVKK